MEAVISESDETDDKLSKLKLNNYGEVSVEIAYEIITISEHGDIVIRVASDLSEEVASFRVSSIKLCKGGSSYFARLLSDRYAEGSRVASDLDQLRKVYMNEDFTQIPAHVLPVVEICGVGQISQIKSIKPLMEEFFKILHSVKDAEDDSLSKPTASPVKNQSPTTTKRPTTPARGSKKISSNNVKASPTAASANMRKAPFINIANLAIVADRFDATKAVAEACKKHGWLYNYKFGAERTKPLTEEQNRQRLLVGMLLGEDSWTAHYSRELIASGSAQWTANSSGSPVGNRQGLWWDLPRGVEEELSLRRTAILSSVQALLNRLLQQYAVKARSQQQCRLGYDTSPQCDAFQLGEFVKHLVKIGRLDLHGTTLFPNETDIDADVSRSGSSGSCINYEGNLNNLFTQLRSHPSHQVNTHHTHCGPKKILVASLDRITALLAKPSCVGICGSCWFDSRGEVEGKSWAVNLTRRRVMLEGYGCKAGHGGDHERARQCFGSPRNLANLVVLEP